MDIKRAFMNIIEFDKTIFVYIKRSGIDIMDTLKLGIIGMGRMAARHLINIMNGKIPHVEVVAGYDIDPQKAGPYQALMGDKGKYFSVFPSAEALMASKKVNAILVASPHYSHPEYAIMALKHNLHVLIEKPAGVYTKQVKELNAAAAKSDRVFGIMFNQRSTPEHQKIRSIINSGELGSLKRVVWLITDWYRVQSYYETSDWRATWDGEGGGVIINQAAHQMDLWQWFFGMPKRIRTFAGFGKYHDIQTEDDVTVYMEYENGMTATLITSTHETPGSNRLEISADMGKIVLENKKLIFCKNCMSEREYNIKYKIPDGSLRYDALTYETIDIDYGKSLIVDEQHVVVFNNFADVIRNGGKLIAPGPEGINGVILTNAIYLSSFIDGTVEIPIDDDLYLSELNKRIVKYGGTPRK